MNNKVDFNAFDTEKIDEYSAQAKESWGKTEAWQEYEQKSAGRSKEQERILGANIMEIFAEFGQVMPKGAESEEALALVKRLQDYITEHFYTCTDEILESLSLMYADGGEMTANIDKAGGKGTASFAKEAIEAYLLTK